MSLLKNNKTFCNVSASQLHLISVTTAAQALAGLHVKTGGTRASCSKLVPKQRSQTAQSQPAKMLTA